MRKSSAIIPYLLSSDYSFDNTVSRMLGYTNIKTIQIYARIARAKISQDMEILSQRGKIGKVDCGEDITLEQAERPALLF